MTSMLVLYYFIALLAAFKGEGTCKNPDADVLILGAGMSGIASAKTLYDNGVTDFIILEARDEIGGRMRAVDFAGVKVEVGANWIQGVDASGSGGYAVNPIWALARRCGLQGEFSDFRSLLVYEDGTDATDKLRWDDIELALEGAAKDSIAMQQAGEPDISLSAGLADNGWTPVTPGDNFLDWYYTDYCFAEPPTVTSLYRTQPDHTHTNFGDEDFFVTDQRGYAHLVECLGAEFLNEDRLCLKTTIKLIEYGDDCVCATDVDGVKYCANYGIFTFSIGVLLQQSKKTAMTFKPDLPKYKRDAISTFRAVVFLKIFLEFNETSWDNNVQFIGHASSNREDYTIFQPMGQFFDSKPNVLLATLTGETAFRVAAQDIEITKQEVRSALTSMYGEFRPEIIDILVPDWASNPLYRGSYADTPIGLRYQTQDIIATPVGKLYFGGGVTNKLYTDYVHGAYLAGVDVANSILRDMWRIDRLDL